MNQEKEAAAHYVDWQARAKEFSVGDSVELTNERARSVGRVVQVHRGIGMVDVQFPNYQSRIPVEDLTLLAANSRVIAPMHENIPGGIIQNRSASSMPSPIRVAYAYVDGRSNKRGR